MSLRFCLLNSYTSCAEANQRCKVANGIGVMSRDDT
jgi:hypothetical protein